MSKTNRFAGIYEFITVARHGSFTAAATALGITRSALAKSIARLEERLGARLFHRSTRRLSLTSDGQTFLVSCTRIMSEFEFAENAVGTDVPIIRGRLRIDMPAAFGRMHIMPRILDFLTEHQELSITASFTDKRIDIIDDGVDLAIRIGFPPDTMEVIAREIGQQQLIICGSPEYFKRCPAPKTKDEIAYHRCIVGRRNQATSSWLVRDDTGINARHPVIGHYEFGDGNAMLGAALKGLGLAQLPTWLAEKELQDGRLVPVLEKIKSNPVPIVAVWPASSHTPLRVKAIVDYLQQSLASS